MNIDFTGKKVAICGGSRGIGRAMALTFAAAGADVSICARGAGALEETRTEIAALGHIAHAGSADMSDKAAIEGYFASAASALGGIDVLINNASAFGSSDDEAGWMSSMAVDMMAIVHATHAALPFLKAGKGSVINAIKAAVIHYTNSQAAMYARDGIRVNGIAPGSIEFPGGVWDRRKTENPPLYNAVLKSIPFGRLGLPTEIANVALFLASPMASWVTGQTIVVDGGQML